MQVFWLALDAALVWASQDAVWALKPGDWLALDAARELASQGEALALKPGDLLELDAERELVLQESAWMVDSQNRTQQQSRG